MSPSRSLRRLIAGAGILLLAACAPAPTVSTLRNAGDEAGRHWIRHELPAELLAMDRGPLRVVARRTVPFPQTDLLPSGDPLPPAVGLYFGDVTGGPGAELVMHTSRTLTILSGTGRELFSRTYPDERRLPHGLADLDGDGKLDVVSGSLRAPRHNVTALSGTGYPVFRFAPMSRDRRHAALTVGYLDDERAVLLARELWPSDPRGLIALSRPNGAMEWEFYLSANPSGIVPIRLPDGRQRLVPSYVTRHNGLFLAIGAMENLVPGGDVDLNLVQAAPDGTLARLERLEVPGSFMPRIVTFLPLTAGPADGASRDLLMVIDYEYRSDFRRETAEPGNTLMPTMLLRIDAESGELRSSATFAPFALVDFRLLPHRTGTESTPFLLTLETGDDGPELRAYDAAFTVVGSRALSAADVALGPVLVGSDGSARILLYADGNLLLANPELRIRPLVTNLPPLTTWMTAPFSDVGRHRVPTAAFNRRLGTTVEERTLASPARIALSLGGEGGSMAMATDEGVEWVEFEWE